MTAAVVHSFDRPLTLEDRPVPRPGPAQVLVRSVVAVFGAGGLGHLAIQYARIAGAAVIAVDVNPARLETEREIGAEHTVNPREEDPVAAIRRLGGADAAISTAVIPEAFEQAFRSLARGGKLVCVGRSPPGSCSACRRSRPRPATAASPHRDGRSQRGRRRSGRPVRG